MMPKRIMIRCPQCQGTLEFNLDTLKVERHWAGKAEGAAPEDFGALVDRVAKRAGEGLPDIGRMLEEQQQRRDAAFEKAIEIFLPLGFTLNPPQPPKPEVKK